MRPHQQSCDQHVRYYAGCADCARRNVRYYTRRIMHGQPLSQPAALTIQRVRELRALGYNLETLADETGVGTAHLKRLAAAECEWVQLRTYHGVEAAHRRLRDLPGTSWRAALVARKAGWLPPEPAPMPALVDEGSVDDVAVDRAVAGERTPLTRAETLAAWEILERRGMTANKIAERLHTTEKSVQRWRSGEHKPSSSRARKRTA